MVRGRAATRGVILVGILWLMVVCAALAIALRIHFSGVAANARSANAAVALRASAESILAPAAMRIRNNAASGIDPLFAFTQNVTLGTITLSGDFANEAGRIDLNTAREELLIGLFRAAMPDQASANRAVRALMDLRAEADQRESLPPAIADPRMLDALGAMPAAAQALVEDNATVASGLDTVRLDAVDADVLADVPGLEPEVLAGLRRHAAGDISDRQLQAILNASQFHAQAPAQSWRAEIEATDTRTGARQIYRAIFSVIPEDSAGYRILDWETLVRPDADRADE
ncbi:MAG: hypothetical protein MUC58_01735 [Rhizobiaceae bacterium]|jgi:hypothetical protein|nr:hypothetical protein [Rhizobiaceae bacterium]